MLIIAGLLSMVALSSVLLIETTSEVEVDSDELPNDPVPDMLDASGDLFEFLEEDDPDDSDAGPLGAQTAFVPTDETPDLFDDALDEEPQTEPDIFDVTEGPAIFWDFKSGVDNLVVMHSADEEPPEITIEEDPEAEGQWLVYANDETVALVEGNMPSLSDVQVVAEDS